MKTLKRNEGGTQVLRRICFHCGMLPADWLDNGFVTSDEVYCCRGCAEKTGCTCEPDFEESREGNYEF